MKYYGDTVRAEIIDAGLKLWKQKPRIFNASEVGRAVNMHRNTVLYHFPSDELIDAVALEAVKRGESEIILQLIGMRHHSVQSLSDIEKLEHFKNVLQINHPY